jgi:hypothetical protein
MVFPMPRQRLFLIDTFGFIFRAFHARGRQAVASMRTSTGIPTEAVYIFNNMLRKLTAAALLAICVAASQLCAQTVEITSPTDGALFHPGQLLDITVKATPSAFRTVVVGVGNLHPSGLSNVLTAPPYRFQIQIPSDTVPGPYTLMAVGVTHAGNAVDSVEVTIAVERPDNPLRLESDLRTVNFDYSSGSAALLVDGIFPDGSRVSLTRSTLTRFISDRPSVVTVDANFVVTAVGPGSASITVTNGKARLVIPVTVANTKRPAD